MGLKGVFDEKIFAFPDDFLEILRVLPKFFVNLHGNLKNGEKRRKNLGRFSDNFRKKQKNIIDMTKRLLKFLDASPVNFLAVKNIADGLETAGYKRIDAQKPLGKVKAGDKLFVTKNDSAVFAFEIGKKPLADAGFHMICAHSDSPTFRIKPNAEMQCEGGIVKLNTEVYGGPIMSTWFDRPLTIAGRVILKGKDAMNPVTKLVHVKRPLMQISNLAIHFNRQVNDGVKLSKQKDVLPILGIITDEMEKGNLLINLICKELKVKAADILDFDLYLADTQPACTFGIHDEFISSGRLDDLSMAFAGLEALLASPKSDMTKVLAISTTKKQVRRRNKAPEVRSSPRC